MKEMEKRGRSCLPFRDRVRGEFVGAVRNLWFVDFDIGDCAIHLQQALLHAFFFLRSMDLRHQSSMQNQSKPFRKSLFVCSRNGNFGSCCKCNPDLNGSLAYIHPCTDLFYVQSLTIPLLVSS